MLKCCLQPGSSLDTRGQSNKRKMFVLENVENVHIGWPTSQGRLGGLRFESDYQKLINHFGVTFCIVYSNSLASKPIPKIKTTEIEYIYRLRAAVKNCWMFDSWKFVREKWLSLEQHKVIVYKRLMGGNWSQLYDVHRKIERNLSDLWFMIIFYCRHCFADSTEIPFRVGKTVKPQRSTHNDTIFMAIDKSSVCKYESWKDRIDSWNPHNRILV